MIVINIIMDVKNNKFKKMCALEFLKTISRKCNS